MVEGFSIVGFLNQLVDKHEESWIDAKYVNLIFSSILPTFKTRPSACVASRECNMPLVEIAVLNSQ